jgi:hypothetical protein
MVSRSFLRSLMTMPSVHSEKRSQKRPLQVQAGIHSSIRVALLVKLSAMVRMVKRSPPSRLSNRRPMPSTSAFLSISSYGVVLSM